MTSASFSRSSLPPSRRRRPAASARAPSGGSPARTARGRPPPRPPSTPTRVRRTSRAKVPHVRVASVLAVALAELLRVPGVVPRGQLERLHLRRARPSRNGGGSGGFSAPKPPPARRSPAPVVRTQPRRASSQRRRDAQGSLLHLLRLDFPSFFRLLARLRSARGARPRARATALGSRPRTRRARTAAPGLPDDRPANDATVPFSMLARGRLARRRRAAPAGGEVRLRTRLDARARRGRLVPPRGRLRRRAPRLGGGAGVRFRAASRGAPGVRPRARRAGDALAHLARRRAPGARLLGHVRADPRGARGDPRRHLRAHRRAERLDGGVRVGDDGRRVGGERRPRAERRGAHVREEILFAFLAFSTALATRARGTVRGYPRGRQ